MDQFFALIEAGLESRRIGFRNRIRDCARQSPVQKAADPKMRGVRREWLKRPGVKRNAIVAVGCVRAGRVQMSMSYGHYYSLTDRGSSVTVKAENA